MWERANNLVYFFEKKRRKEETKKLDNFAKGKAQSKAQSFSIDLPQFMMTYLFFNNRRTAHSKN